jgi:hypothetical protein
MRSTNGYGSYILVAVTLATLALGPARTTEAKTPHLVTATVNGKRIKWKGHFVQLTDSQSGFFSLAASKVNGSKTIGVGCGILLAGQTFPLTLTTGCSMTYQARKHGASQIWLNPGLDASNPVTVTFQSFDGTIVQATFNGVLMSGTFGGSTLSIQGSIDAALAQ